MQICKKIISILFSSIMVVGTVITASAAESHSYKAVTAESNPYQAVIDKLNNEYSLNIHFMTPVERQAYSVSSQRDIDITPEEFENNLREAIIENERAKVEADKKLAELETKDIVERGSGICRSVSMPESRTRTTVTRSKNIAGATAYLRATVSNSPGHWVYSSISTAYTTYVNGVNSTPPFFANTYDYSLLDSRRTCALKFYGYTLGDYGVIIDDNAYRYVEFWAGSGM